MGYLKISHQLSTFSGHIQCGVEDIMFLICHAVKNSKILMSLQYLKEEVRDEVDILHAERQSFLQVDFNNLAIKLSYKVILTLLIVILKVLKVKRLHYLYNITKLN